MTEARPGSTRHPPADERGPGRGRVRRGEPAASKAAAAAARAVWPARCATSALSASLVVLAIVGVVTTDGQFLTRSNILNILVSASIIGVVTVGMTFVIIGGGIDLSVGALVALASVWATTLATQSYGRFVMVICALLVGMGARPGQRRAHRVRAAGRRSSSRWRCWSPPAGWPRRCRTGGPSWSRSHAINDIATTDVLGIPLLVYLFAAVVAIGWLVLNRTTFGRRTFAVGGNPEAARLAGIDVRRHTALLYVLSGLCCGIAAVMIMARTTTGSSTHGDLYELDAIAAVIIGGTLLTGGRGTLIGSILGVLVFTTITNLFVLNNLPTEVQNIAKGLDHRRRRAAAAAGPDGGRPLDPAAPAEGARRRPDPLMPSDPPRRDPVMPRSAVPARRAHRRRSADMSDLRTAGLDRRRFLAVGGLVGAGAVLAACTSNDADTAGTTRRKARRPRPATTTTPPPARRSRSASPAPQADHGWIAAISKNAEDAGEEVPRRDVRAGRGDQRGDPADLLGGDADREEGQRAGDPALRRQGADRGRAARRWTRASRWSTSTGSSTLRRRTGR